MSPATERLLLQAVVAMACLVPLTIGTLGVVNGPAFLKGMTGVAIDLDSPRIGEDGVALFDDKGEPTTYTQSIMALFRDLVRGTEQTRQFTETLMQLKLLEPVDINASFDDGTRRTFTGLYTINQNNLRALPAEDVLEHE